MATETKQHEDTGHDDHDDHHPSDTLYWKVGGALGLLTALEVSTYFRVGDDPYSDSLGTVIIVALLVMMVIKFIVIGAFFMHLKFDNKIFRRVFVTGLVLAVLVYLAVMTTFSFFSTTYEEQGALSLLL